VTKDKLQEALAVAHADIREFEEEIRGLREERRVTLEMDGLKLERNGNGDCYITIDDSEAGAHAKMEITHCEALDMVNFLKEWNKETDG